jgi:pyruvate kinase
LGPRRHINLPGVKVNPAADRGTAISASGFQPVSTTSPELCREAADIETLKRSGEQGSQARVIAKIEDQHAVSVVDDIIENATPLWSLAVTLGLSVQWRNFQSYSDDRHEVYSEGHRLSARICWNR